MSAVHEEAIAAAAAALWDHLRQERKNAWKPWEDADRFDLRMAFIEMAEVTVAGYARTRSRADQLAKQSKEAADGSE
jgi:hypothetical protein